MPSFIQITDTHIVARGALTCGRSDTATALQQAIATINAKLPLLEDVECAIVTGDLTDHGTPEEYAHFSAIMAALDLPWLAVPGNHDRRDTMRAAFADRFWMPEDGPIHWTRDFGTFSMIGLDTLLEEAHHGELSNEGFEFLEVALSAIGDQPIVVATHHPCVPSGIPSMDVDNLRNGAKLLERLSDHPASVRMISGHVHRAVTGQIGSITCQIAPAPGHAVAIDHRADQEPGLVLEPGAFTVYRWKTEMGPCLISDIVPVGTFSGPWPFED